jgi:hypothetical protein
MKDRDNHRYHISQLRLCLSGSSTKSGVERETLPLLAHHEHCSLPLATLFEISLKTQSNFFSLR